MIKNGIEPTFKKPKNYRKEKEFKPYTFYAIKNIARDSRRSKKAFRNWMNDLQYEVGIPPIWRELFRAVENEL